MAILAEDRSSGGFCFVRQPGEYRNLRMSHSVGYQNLVAFGVVAYSPGITDVQSYTACRGSANCSYWRDIAICRYREDGDGRVAHVSDVNFIELFG